MIELQKLKISELMKKRGFMETLELLNGFEGKKVVQTKFFQKIEESNTYYNAYLRMKTKLIDFGLIEFSLGNKKQKLIGITEKGQDIYSRIMKIDALL